MYNLLLVAFVFPAEEDGCSFTFISDRDCVLGLLVICSFLSNFSAIVRSFLTAFVTTGLDMREFKIPLIGLDPLLLLAVIGVK